MSAITFDEKNTYLFSQPHRIISGAMHYFRVCPEQWEDRLVKLKEMGLNTIETYCAWHWHQPEKGGAFNFTGRMDLGAYIDLCAKLGLNVIVRPGPFICSECDFGGLPWWLLTENCALRCNDPDYLKHVFPYLDAISEILLPRQIERGGNVIAVQVENEYGGFTVNNGHIETLAEYYRNKGFECLLFTSDGAWKSDKFMFRAGKTSGVYATGNFRGTEAVDSVQMLRDEQNNLCPTVAEFWNGRSIKYGMDYSHRSSEEIASHLDAIMSTGANVNIYMAHGGTNFGYMNGAVYEPHEGKSTFLIQSSSYDVDAPLNEYGEITTKYVAEREILYKHLGRELTPLPKSTVKLMGYGEVKLQRFAMFDNLNALASRTKHAYRPLTFEEFGQGSGTVIYSTTISSWSDKPMRLSFEAVHDVATVYANGKLVGEVWRDHEKETVLSIDVSKPGTKLDIVVESMGRCNFGAALYDRKGIIGNVIVAGNRVLNDFNMTGVTYESLPQSLEVGSEDGHGVYCGEFEVSEIGDTFVKLENFKRGIISINGFILGRHFGMGPHKTVYLPAPLLKKGKNVLVVTDCEHSENKKVSLVDKSELTGEGRLRSPFGDTSFTNNAVVVK